MAEENVKKCVCCGGTKGILNRRGEPVCFPRGLCAKCYHRWHRHGDPAVIKHVMGESRATQPEYHVWAGMIRRCENPKDKSYNRYGGRGIKVCNEWHDYGRFIKDMGRRPKGRYSLERVNNDGDYCPENCKWADDNEQAVNKRNNTIVPGVTYNKRDKMWRAHLERHGQCVLDKSFKSFNDAVFARKKAEHIWLRKEINLC